MIWLLRQFRLLRDAIYAKDTPRQMALGLAVGAMLGLMPKGNLLAIMVATLLFGTRVSVATGLLSAAVFSLLSPLCDPLTHRLGASLLTQSTLVPVWRWLSHMPLAAWTSFNNTVVMGNLILGGVLFYPIYRVSLPWIERYREMMAERGDSDTEDSDDELPVATPIVHPMVDGRKTAPDRARPAQRRDVA